jgi:8-oxo-dGTP diphosphatase
MNTLNNHLTGHVNNHGYHAQEISLLNSVDCVIFGFDGQEIKVLLVRFPYEPFRGHWSLIGGFVKPEISIDEAARQTVQKMTGLDDVYMEQVYSFGDVQRVPSERVITTCYYALIRVEPTLSKLTRQFEATWTSIKELPPMVYDHAEMLDKALNKLRRKVRYQPIGFELLPEKFTMTELRSLYNSILGKDLEKRNFSKKFFNLGLLRKLDEQNKLTSRRGAFYFRFDEQKYHELISEGYLLEFVAEKKPNKKRPKPDTAKD